MSDGKVPEIESSWYDVWHELASFGAEAVFQPGLLSNVTSLCKMWCQSLSALYSLQYRCAFSIFVGNSGWVRICSTIGTADWWFRCRINLVHLFEWAHCGCRTPLLPSVVVLGNGEVHTSWFWFLEAILETPKSDLASAFCRGAWFWFWWWKHPPRMTHTSDLLLLFPLQLPWKSGWQCRQRAAEERYFLLVMFWLHSPLLHI